MKSSLLNLLVCPSCTSSFEVRADTTDGSEIMEGVLICRWCGECYPISRGIPRFLPKDLAEDKKATANAFGYEWTNFSQMTEEDRREFLGWISPLAPADFKGRVVLDCGCGKGRHIFLAAQFGAQEVVGVDLSDAVEAAYANTHKLPNVHVVQADIYNLPFAKPFNLAYSIGVLHHLPVPKQGFLAMVGHLAPGGRVVSWVYGKEGNIWIEKLVDPVRKNVTSRLPQAATRFLAFFPAVVLYAALKLLYRPARHRPLLKKMLPYSDYICSIADYSFTENFWNVFDQLVAPTAFYHSRDEIVDWYQTADIEQVQISQYNSNSWRGTGLIPLGLDEGLTTGAD